MINEEKNRERITSPNQDSQTTTVELRGLETGYRVKGKNVVIGENLNAHLNKCELVCLLGPNGAGKSTLLKTLVGFIKPLSGHVMIMGRDIKEYNSNELSKLVSVVLTDNSDIKNMSVYDVIAMGRSPYTGFWGRLDQKDKKAVDNCLQWMGIEELKDRKMQTLSDGERQKVMIGKAIAQETPVIMLDEPTAFLDYPSKMSMLMLLRRMSKALRKTIFLSTHDVEHALQIADHIWLLDKKLGLTTGSPEDLCINGKIEEYFDNEGMTFDRRRASFSIQYQTVNEVVVEGDLDSVEGRMLTRALNRNSIKPLTSSDDRDIVLKVDNKGRFHLIHFGRELMAFDNVEHAVDETSRIISKTKMIKLKNEDKPEHDDDVTPTAVDDEIPDVAIEDE